MTRQSHSSSTPSSQVQATQAIRQRLQARRQRHQQDLQQEIQRLAVLAAQLGLQRMILFGSVARGDAGLASDLDLLIVWDTPLDFLTRTVQLYRQLQPRVPVDLLVYTPDEMKTMCQQAFVRKIIQEGSVLYEA